MIPKMKNFIKYSLLGLAVALTGCNDYLDCEPETNVSSSAYFYAENDLEAYASNLYTWLPSHGVGSWNLGLFANDNGTDNQTASQPSGLFVPDQNHVGDAGNLWSSYFGQIRTVNYFFDHVLPLQENGQITGSNVDHYIGEMYFFRAWVYYNALKNLGDFPIIETQVSDDYAAVRDASQRRPRNEVARFIISDLDKAYKLMNANPPKVRQRNRLSRDCAALLKSRVALFEATWEKYHAGTPFVPRSAGWPGASKDYLADYTYNPDTEIKYFLQQAIEAADIVAQAHPALHSDYAAIFNSVSLSGMDEVLLWRQYSTSSEATVTHNVVNYLQRNGGGNTGYTRSMVDAYLMKDGKPVYASADYKGDDSYEHLFDGRDPRMDLTILKTGDLLSVGPNLVDYVKTTDGFGYFYRAPIFEGQAENSNPTGYSLRKGLNTSADMQVTKPSYTACPTFRVAEAMLNYIEAYYELNGSLGGNCGTYWSALRQRAGMSTDYAATIAATDMSREKADWGSYSANAQVDATLYNIRRERRIELASEGFRLDDLRRWRALDQVSNVHIQGCNFWAGICDLYTDPNPEDAGSPLSVITFKIYGDDPEPNISAKDDPYADGGYLLPYRRAKNNIGANGLTWTTANYLYPIVNREFRLTTSEPGSGDLATSPIYQNPGWSTEDGSLPL